MGDALSWVADVQRLHPQAEGSEVVPFHAKEGNVKVGRFTTIASPIKKSTEWFRVNQSKTVVETVVFNEHVPQCQGGWS